MEIITDAAQRYAARYTSGEDILLREISNQTNASHPQAHMMSGHVQGKLLELLSCLVNPTYVLEIGTFTGYSAICLARGLKEGGQLHTIEVRQDDAAVAKENFNKSNEREKILLHIGDALEIIPTLNFAWDIVFIDADKPSYIEYYKLVLPKLRSGGLIIADNVLFHGEVLQDPVTGKNAKAIQEFNDFVMKDMEVENVLLTVRDGLMLIIKS